MNPERWKKIEEIFQDALDLSGGEREKFIAEKTGDDAELRTEVEKLVARFETEEEFLESPVWTDSRILGNTLKSRVASSLEKELAPAHKEKSFTGKRIGAYRLTEQIGRGGMGVVYAAERDDGEFSQTVAVKLIKRGMDTDFIVSRFRHERQILARLNHPNIARLLDGGTTDDDLPFFVMEYIEGKPFLKYCEEKNLDLRQKLELFLQVCSPIIYAHKRKIIHRDIKPSNILVNEDGEPKLLDFGIAKLLDADSIHESYLPTATAMRLMTPEYASPEQVRGEEITSASDQYSLGVLLYELITGARPYKFSSRAPHEIARVICEFSPSSFVLRPFFKEKESEEINKVVLKSLRKNPAERFSSVEEFAADIERFLQKKEVRAESFANESEQLSFSTQKEKSLEITKEAVRDTNGNFSGAIEKRKGKAISPRWRGIKQGIFITILSLFSIPVLLLITITAILPPQVLVTAFVLFFLGGFVRIIYALLFESGEKADDYSAAEKNRIAEAETELINPLGSSETIIGRQTTAEKTFESQKSFDQSSDETGSKTATEKTDDSLAEKKAAQTFEPNGNVSTKSKLQPAEKTRRFPAALKYILSAFFLTVLGFGLYNFLTHLEFDASSIPPAERWKNNFTSMMNVRRLTATGIVQRAVVSPDGKQIVYVSGDNQKQSLRIRETDSETERELVAPEAIFYLEVKFSPDGAYVYYLLDRTASPRILRRISTVGGTSENISEEVFNSFALSSDGQKIAYDFANKEKKNYNIRVADLVEGKTLQNPQFVTEIFHPDYYMGNFAFSPDDKKLMYAVSKIEESKEVVNLFVHDFEMQTETQLTTRNFSDMTGGVWRTGGEEIVICATEENSSLYQLWLVSFPSGEVTHLTNDFYDYFGASLTADSSAFVTVKKDSMSNLWTSELTASSRDFDSKTKQVTNKNSRQDGIEGVNWTKNGRILYISSANGESGIATIKTDGSDNQIIPVKASKPAHPLLTSDNRYLVFADEKDQKMNIRRFDLQTGEAAEISSRYAVTPTLAPDDQFVFYTTFSGKSKMTSIHRKSLFGDDETEVTHNISVSPAISPDGKFVACLLSSKETGGEFQIAIFPSEKTDGNPLKIIKVFQNGNLENPQSRSPAWSADGKFLYFVNAANDTPNIFRAAIEGDQKPAQMTFFASGKIFDFALAPDGKTVVLSRGSTSTDIVLFKKSR